MHGRDGGFGFRQGRVAAVVTAVALFSLSLFVFAPVAGASSVTAASVEVPASSAGATGVTYTVKFTTSAVLPNGGTFTLTAPAGTVFEADAQYVTTVLDPINGLLTGFGANSGTNTVVVPAPSGDFSAGSMVTIVASGVTNAPTAGAKTLAVSTSSDTTPVSAPYTLTPGPTSVTGATVVASVTTPGTTGVTYTVDFTTSAAGALGGRHGTITFAAPAGTVFTASSSAQVLAPPLFSAQVVSGPGTATLVLELLGGPLGLDVVPGHTPFQIQVDNVTNTGTSGIQNFRISTSSDQGVVSVPIGIGPSAAPVITSASSANFPAGVGGSFTVTSAGIPIPVISAAPLPSGVTFTDNRNGTGTLTVGAATAVGVYTITIGASNAIAPNATQTFTLTVANAPPRTLTVTKAGTGAGTVTSAPPGINCGATCSAIFANGTSVTLTAAAAAGSSFTGWTGVTCPGTGTCVVTLTANTTVTATFSPNPTLTVSKAGTGTGTVTSSPAGITCGTDCSESYANGTSVVLTAAPAAGSTFAGWSGACTNATGTCTVSMTAARAVTATFTGPAPQTLSVTTAGTGSGSVTSSPGGITCPTDCSESFANGTSVVLTAAPAAGSTFAGWSGACTNATGTCTVSMTAARAVTATFTGPPPQTLTVTTAGTGSGSVTSSPAGITCPTDCSESYTNGTSVVLTAVPAAGSTFAGWSGACTNATGTCTVSMTAARAVTATFTGPPPRTLTVTKAGTGAGTVTSAPTGINCGATCSASFANGTSVTLTAAPAAGSSFTGWTGVTCPGTGTCLVTLAANTTVTATFSPTPRPPVADPMSVSTPKNMAVLITLSGSDPDGDPLTFAIVSGPAHGTLTGIAPNVTYTPAAGYTGADSFSFKVNDGKVDSAAATVAITVTAPGKPPRCHFHGRRSGGQAWHVSKFHHWLKFSAHRGAVEAILVSVNGRYFGVPHLNAGETRRIDVADALKSTGNNRVTMFALGSGRSSRARVVFARHNR